MKRRWFNDDGVLHRFRQEAARRNTTPMELVHELIDRLVKQGRELPPLPVFDLGRASVDVSDRDELYRAMEER